MSVDEVVAWLEQVDARSVVAGLLDLDERERKALGPKARGWLTKGNETRVSTDQAALAVIATAGGVRQAMVAPTNMFHVEPAFCDDAAAILKARDPHWLPDFVEALLDDGWPVNWRMARAIVRCGAAPEPNHSEYYRGTVRGVPNYSFQARSSPLLHELEHDPALIGEHLIGMLSTEGVGRLLTYHDHWQETPDRYSEDRPPFPEGTWRVTLLSLAADNRLDRGRLLDTVLAAPLRDWAPVDLGWFIGMHDTLQPTVDEVATRQLTYARLLTAEHGPAVKTAQRELLRLLDQERLDPEPVLDASRATLTRTDKAAVVTQLRLLEKAAQAFPTAAVADTVRLALDHPRADVRERTTKLLDTLGVGVPEPKPAAVFVAPAPTPLPDPDPVEPVDTPDELAELLLALMEEPAPLDVERALDGLIRFASERPSTADLVLARAEGLQYYEDDPRVVPDVLARAWLTPRRRRHEHWVVVLAHTTYPMHQADPGTLPGFLGRRITGIVHAVRRGELLSVALPTHDDGSIAPDVLSARLADVRRNRRPLELDLGVALLRVPHDQRADVTMPSSWRRAKAVRRLLGAPPPEWERDVVTDKPRASWQPEVRALVFRDQSGRDGDTLDGLHSRPNPERTVADELSYGEYESRFEHTLTFGALHLPQDPDVLAAHAHPYLVSDLEKGRAISVGLVDALARSRTPPGDPAASALLLALAAKDARARTAAQDALLDLARHGLLDGTRLGQQAAALLGDELVVAKRISAGLTEVARADDAVVLPMLDALQTLLPVLTARRDAGPFVELAADLADRSGRRLDLPDELRELAAGKSTSMIAKAARRLL